MPGGTLVRLAAEDPRMMLFADQNREQLRQGWRAAWQRHRAGLPLEPLQAQIVDVIALHPDVTGRGLGHRLMQRSIACKPPI